MDDMMNISNSRGGLRQPGMDERVEEVRQTLAFLRRHLSRATSNWLNRMKLRDEVTLIDFVMILMMVHGASPDVQAAGIALLHSLAIKSEPAHRDFCENGAVDCALLAMRQHQNHSENMISCTSLLAWLARPLSKDEEKAVRDGKLHLPDDPSAAAAQIATEDGIELTVQSLKSNSKDFRTYMAGMHLLSALGQYGKFDNRSSDRLLELMEVANNALGTWPKNRILKGLATNVIARVQAADHTGITKTKKK